MNTSAQTAVLLVRSLKDGWQGRLMELSPSVKYAPVNNNLVGCWKGEIIHVKWLTQCVFPDASGV